MRLSGLRFTVSLRKGIALPWFRFAADTASPIMSTGQARSFQRLRPEPAVFFTPITAPFVPHLFSFLTHFFGTALAGTLLSVRHQKARKQSYNIKSLFRQCVSYQFHFRSRGLRFHQELRCDGAAVARLHHREEGGANPSWSTRATEG